MSSSWAFQRNVDCAGQRREGQKWEFSCLFHSPSSALGSSCLGTSKVFGRLHYVRGPFANLAPTRHFGVHQALPA